MDSFSFTGKKTCESKRIVLCRKRFLYPLGYDISTKPISLSLASNSNGVANLVVKLAIVLAG